MNRYVPNIFRKGEIISGRRNPYCWLTPSNTFNPCAKPVAVGKIAPSWYGSTFHNEAIKLAMSTAETRIPKERYSLFQVLVLGAILMIA